MSIHKKGVSQLNICVKCSNGQGVHPRKSINHKDSMSFQKDQANKENERTIKKLMAEVQRYSSFLKSLMENYSLPENLMEDIREIIYEEEMTQYDNNNEFFAQLPLSPISAQSLQSMTLPIGSAKKAAHDKNKKMVPFLDLTKLTKDYD